MSTIPGITRLGVMGFLAIMAWALIQPCFAHAAGGPPLPGPRLRVALITMGPGDHPYTRFGHTALLVERAGALAGGARINSTDQVSGPSHAKELETQARSEEGARWWRATNEGHRLCFQGRAGRREFTCSVLYNFGMSDFDRRGLIWDFLRGTPLFWVATQRLQQTLAEYRSEDRSISRQDLALSALQAAELDRLLRVNLRPDNRHYVYHHFRDNCATRPRDLLDRVLGGRVNRQLKRAPSGLTLRVLMHQGFAGQVGLLLLTDLVVGRAADRPVNLWQASFLPSQLSQALSRVTLPSGPLLAGPPQYLYRRKGPSPLAHDPLPGSTLPWILAGSALLASLVMVLLGRRQSRWTGLPLIPMALVSGLSGSLVWGLMLASTLPELRANELALILWPTDLLLLATAGRWLANRPRAGRLLHSYARARIAVLSLTILGHLVGVLIQRPLAWLVLALALALGLHLTIRGFPRR